MKFSNLTNPLIGKVIFWKSCLKQNLKKSVGSEIINDSPVQMIFNRDEDFRPNDRNHTAKVYFSSETRYQEKISSSHR